MLTLQFGDFLLNISSIGKLHPTPSTLGIPDKTVGLGLDDLKLGADLTLLLDHETFAIFELVESLAFSAYWGVFVAVVAEDGIDFGLESEAGGFESFDVGVESVEGGFVGVFGGAFDLCTVGVARVEMVCLWVLCT